MTTPLTPSSDGRVRFTIDMSQAVADDLVRIARTLNVDTANVVARVFALLPAAVEAKQAGHCVWFIDAERKQWTEILGLEPPASGPKAEQTRRA